MNILKTINSKILKFIKNSENSIIKRKRKLSLKDIIYTLFLKQNSDSKNYNSYSSVIVNTFQNVSKQSIIKKRKQIEESFFTNINDILYNCYLKQNNIKNKYRFVAVDGSKLSFPLKLKEYGYDITTSSGSYCKGTLSTLYDVDNKMVINSIVSNSYNERALFIKQLTYLRKNDIVICDRGYVSWELIEKLNEKNIDFILRIKRDYLCVKEILEDSTSDKIIKLTSSNISCRLVKYKVENNDYYILTSLLDKNISIDKISEYYRKRWSIEELFKIYKKNMQTNNIVSKSELFIKQEIYLNSFINNLSRIIEKIVIKKYGIDKNKKISFNCVLKQCNKIIKILLYQGVKIKKILNIATFLLNTLYFEVLDRHYPRTIIMKNTVKFKSKKENIYITKDECKDPSKCKHKKNHFYKTIKLD